MKVLMFLPSFLLTLEANALEYGSIRSAAYDLAEKADYFYHQVHYQGGYSHIGQKAKDLAESSRYIHHGSYGSSICYSVRYDFQKVSRDFKDLSHNFQHGYTSHYDYALRDGWADVKIAYFQLQNRIFQDCPYSGYYDNNYGYTYPRTYRSRHTYYPGTYRGDYRNTSDYYRYDSAYRNRLRDSTYRSRVVRRSQGTPGTIRSGSTRAVYRTDNTRSSNYRTNRDHHYNSNYSRDSHANRSTYRHSRDHRSDRQDYNRRDHGHQNNHHESSRDYTRPTDRQNDYENRISRERDNERTQRENRSGVTRTVRR